MLRGDFLWQIEIKLISEKLPLYLYMFILLNRCHNVTFKKLSMPKLSDY